jgi:hypothetical protein
MRFASKKISIDCVPMRFKEIGIIGQISQSEKLSQKLLKINDLQLGAGFKPAPSLRCDNYLTIP